MRRPDTARTWITLVLLALFPCFIAFEGIEPIQAAEYGSVIMHPTLFFGDLNIGLGALSNIISALTNIFNSTPAKSSEGPAVSDADKKKGIDYSVLVYTNNSDLLIEDHKGTVISRRKAGSSDAGAIRDAINRTDHGIILCIGTFRILSPINNLKSGITLKGLPGATVFDCTKMRSTVFLCDEKGSGYAEHTTPLLDDVLEGSGAIKVKDAKSYHEGDFVKLIDNESIEGFKKGEILKIGKISGNKILFDGAVRDDYSVKNAANIRKLTMNRDVTVDGIKFVGPGIETNLALFSLSLLEHFRFANNTVANFGRAAIYLSDSLNSVIEDNIFENIYMTGFGYSISVTNACNDIYILDNVFRVKGRHYVTAGAGTGSRNSGGFARNIKIINNSFENCIQEAINSHPPFIGPIEIIGNSFKSCGKGIAIINGNTVIVDNNFTKCPIGIYLLGDEERLHDIHSNEFKDCHDNIKIETSNMTIYGNLYNSKFQMNKDNLEFL